MDVGLAVELWNKGMLWDKLMGTHWLSLTTVKQSSKVTAMNPLCLRRYSNALCNVRVARDGSGQL